MILVIIALERLQSRTLLTEQQATCAPLATTAHLSPLLRQNAPRVLMRLAQVAMLVRTALLDTTASF